MNPAIISTGRVVAKWHFKALVLSPVASQLPEQYVPAVQKMLKDLCLCASLDLPGGEAKNDAGRSCIKRGP